MPIAHDSLLRHTLVMKAAYAMTLDQLHGLLNTKQFHHATYRNFGTLWEGLWIYAKTEGGFRGYTPAGCFPKNDPDLEAAHELVRRTGISVGAYGQG